MKKTFLPNFIRIYTWKTFSIIMNMVSMFIVIPILSKDPIIFGTYMVCISFNIFISYADIGFFGAGFKYCSEYFAKNDLKNEVNLQGFISFIYSVLLLIPFFIFILLSINPQLLISDISNPVQYEIASKLFFIQAFFIFTEVIKKINSTAYGVRLENYKLQKITLVAYFIKIISIFYFFTNQRYDIVGYYLFGKLSDLFANLFAGYRLRKEYNYDFIQFFKKYRLSKIYYNLTKKLARSSFYSSILAFLYIELDSLVITKWYGVKVYSYFAIGLIATKFFRSLFSAIYQPLTARFNHFVGLENNKKLKAFYLKSMVIPFPVVVFPLISIILLKDNLVFTWVGAEYMLSLNMISNLCLGLIFFTLIYRPLHILIRATESYNLIYIFSSIMLFNYWLIIFLIEGLYGVESFPISRLVSNFLISIVCIIIAIKKYNIKLNDFINKLFKPGIITIILLVFNLRIIKPFLPNSEGLFNLIIVISAGGACSFISLIVYYILSRDFKNFFNKVIKSKLKGVY